MNEGENEEVDYRVSVNDEEVHFYPDQLLGLYISDRIQDIKTAQHSDNLCVVLSVSTLN